MPQNPNQPDSGLGAADSLLDPVRAIKGIYDRVASRLTPTQKAPPAPYDDRVQRANDTYRNNPDHMSDAAKAAQAKSVQTEPSGKTPVVKKAVKPIPRKRG